MKLLLITSLIFFTACSKTYIPEGTPSCIEKEIRKFKTNEKCESAAIYRYDFQGAKVYVFSQGGCCCDLADVVRNEKCEVICTLRGFAGKRDCNGDTFSDAATNRVVIWER